MNKEPKVAGALRTFFNIATRWNLTDDACQRLLGVAPNTLAGWRADPESAQPNDETLERLSYVMNIWADLQVVLPQSQAADSWVKRSNDDPIFGGRTPLEHMRSGHADGLADVAGYLHAWRHLK